MKRLFLLMVVLLVGSAPAWTASALPERGQIDITDPAAFVPENVPVYLQLDLSGGGLDQFARAANLAFGMIGAPQAYETNADALAGLVGRLLPQLDAADVLPWVGSRAALVFTPNDAGQLTDYAFVLPIADAAAARAFVTQMRANTFDSKEQTADVPLYYNGLYTLAVSDSTIWIGSPGGIDTLFHAPPESLALNPAYQAVLAELPYSPILGYVSGDTLQALTNWGRPPMDVFLQALLQLHPVQSAFKTALLSGAPVDGLGFAVQASDTQVNATVALKLRATLDTPAAPLTLAGYAPDDSFAVIDSYDVTIPAAFIAANAPVRGYFVDANTPDLLRPQLQPLLDQIVSLMGMSLDEFYGLINGEYLAAAFPGAGPLVSAALWIRSSDPARLIDAVERASHLVLTDPNGTQLFTVERTTVGGVDVALVRAPSLNLRLALGVLDGDVLFITTESTMAKVIAAAPESNPPAWASAFADAQTAAFMLDVRTLDLYALRQERIPPLPLSRIDGALAIHANGALVVTVTGTIGE